MLLLDNEEYEGDGSDCKKTDDDRRLPRMKDPSKLQAKEKDGRAGGDQCYTHRVDPLQLPPVRQLEQRKRQEKQYQGHGKRRLTVVSRYQSVAQMMRLTIGRLIQKIHCQPTYWVKAPPTKGASAAPMQLAPAYCAMYKPRSLRGNRSAIHTFAMTVKAPSPIP